VSGVKILLELLGGRISEKIMMWYVNAGDNYLNVRLKIPLILRDMKESIMWNVH
jgi:hypothetical protein